ncbi:Uncharacterised protein r2_g1758 [Pycnogonum litorale]
MIHRVAKSASYGGKYARRNSLMPGSKNIFYASILLFHGKILTPRILMRYGKRYLRQAACGYVRDLLNELVQMNLIVAHGSHTHSRDIYFKKSISDISRETLDRIGLTLDDYKFCLDRPSHREVLKYEYLLYE